MKRKRRVQRQQRQVRKDRTGQAPGKSQEQSVDPLQDLQGTIGNQAMLALFEGPELPVATMEGLQRQLGNQATLDIVQRYAVRQQAQKQQIQREETGLRQGSAVSLTAGTAEAFASDPGNAEKSPSELIAAIEATLNGSLDAEHVPPISVVQNDGGGNDGTFDFETWTIEIDPQAVFAGKTKISELEPDEVREVADTLHHEARHCEQWFRMARLLAGQKLGVPQPDGRPADETTVAQEIANEMGIPPSAALWAVQEPLTTGDQESAEAQEWYDSVYGANSAYRELILGELDTAINDLAQPLVDLRSAIDLKGQASTPYDKQQAQGEVDYLVMNIDALLQTLYAVRDGALTTEHNRLSAMGSRSPVEATMFAHTGNFINQINLIEGLGIEEATAEQVQTLVQQLGAESYQAYRDLPEETDAWAAGGAVTAAMRQGVSTP